ncbi:MAG: cyclic nucleotide-binding domain-containing protein [Gammaproteobacteria bacterium]|nr:cyclic nucleotide-binding domain-containing protein [Gammaproteobacteria bacterium]
MTNKSEAAKVIDFPKASVTCAICPWARACLDQAFNPAQDENRAQRCSAPLKRNQHIIRQGDELEYLYVLRSGSAKSYFDSSDGLEQIVAFHYPGDLLGFDAIGEGRHQSSIIALETAALCRVPYREAEAAWLEAPKLWTEIMRAAARQMHDKNNHALLLGQKSAAARFASFLLDVSARLAARGCSRTEFNLSMPRQDIANYLSLAVETVSRLFGDLQSNGVIAVDRRFVRIESFERLRAIAGDGGGAAKHAHSG